MNLRLLIACVLALVLLFTHFQAYRYGETLAEAACAQRERDALEVARDKADTASESHEAAREQIKTEIQTVVREVPRVIEKPVYRNVCLDADGLRLVRQAIGSGGAAGEPATAVSPPGRPD